jgi:hypothetical protein
MPHESEAFFVGGESGYGFSRELSRRWLCGSAFSGLDGLAGALWQYPINAINASTREPQAAPLRPAIRTIRKTTNHIPEIARSTKYLARQAGFQP